MQVDSTNGCKIELHDLGGEGPDLVICHATGFNAMAYLPMAQQLTGDFKVWAVDMRGHGSSTPPDDGDFAWQGMAEDLLACIDVIGADSVFAFGHSMGGAAILLTELTRRGVIVAAYLYEPIVFPSDTLSTRGDENVMGAAARKRRAVFPSKQAAMWRYASRPPLDTLRADALAGYVEGGFAELDDGTVQLTCLPEHEARTFECETKMTIERLVGISLPVAVARGSEAGSPNPADFAPLIAETLDDAVLVEFQHLGHFGPQQAPDIVGSSVRDFLVEHARG